MEKKLKQILKYRAWQISDAYERIDNPNKYKLGEKDMEVYYEIIMDFIFFAYDDLMKFEDSLEN